MSIGNIKNKWLRRTLLLLSIPLVIVIGIFLLFIEGCLKLGEYVGEYMDETEAHILSLLNTYKKAW